MRSIQIQYAIAQGLKPFELCHFVSKKIRTSRKHGDHIQDSIGAVFYSLAQQPTAFRPSEFAEPVAFPPVSDIIYTGGRSDNGDAGVAVA